MAKAEQKEHDWVGGASGDGDFEKYNSCEVQLQVPELEKKRYFQKQQKDIKHFWWEARWISEEGMAIYFSVPAGESQGTVEPGVLQSIRSQGVRTEAT